MDNESWYAYIYPKSLTEFEQKKILKELENMIKHSV